MKHYNVKAEVENCAKTDHLLYEIVRNCAKANLPMIAPWTVPKPV